VFVVEQRCAYLDADGFDRDARHLWAARDDGAVHAYLRLLGPGARFAEPSIGRIVTAPEARGTGLGRELVRHGIALARARHGERAIRIAAQAHLERFYGEFGFARASEEFDEDGIPHVEMVLGATSPAGT
jgi:ElaA protein